MSNKSLIYKIVDKTNNNTYYGSTTIDLNKCIQQHKKNYTKYLNDKYRYTTIFDILKNNEYDIELLEEYENITKQELASNLKNYIETNECINKFVSKTNEEKKEKKKMYDKQYYDNNVEHIKEVKKMNYEKNKDVILQKNKEYSKESITCECGAVIKKGNYKKHKLRNVHINRMNKLNQFDEEKVDNTFGIKSSLNNDIDSIQLDEQQEI